MKVTTASLLLAALTLAACDSKTATTGETATSGATAEAIGAPATDPAAAKTSGTQATATAKTVAVITATGRGRRTVAEIRSRTVPPAAVIRARTSTRAASSAAVRPRSSRVRTISDASSAVSLLIRSGRPGQRS